MRTFQRIASPITASANGIALSQTPAADGVFILNGATVVAGQAILSPPRPVVITPTGNETGKTFTIRGLDRGGAPISSNLAGTNATPITSRRIYSRIDSITMSAAGAAPITVGFSALSYSAWITLGNFSGDYDWTCRTFFAATGTANYDIEATSQNMNRARVTGDAADDIFSVATGITGNLTSYNNAPIAAIRLRINSSDVPITIRVMPSRTA